jgi:hypothetical protein
MFGHLPEETLMDVVDGTADPRAREHVVACEACGSRVAEAAMAWSMAQASEVPEPSPLYWEAFRRQVGRRIQGEGRRQWVRFLVPLAAAAGLVVALTRPLSAPMPMVSSVPVAASVLPAWSALPAADDDPGFEVLQAVASSGSDLASSYERGSVQELLSDLSDEESQALAERLKTDGGMAVTL